MLNFISSDVFVSFSDILVNVKEEIIYFFNDVFMRNKRKFRHFKNSNIFPFPQ